MKKYIYSLLAFAFLTYAPLAGVSQVRIASGKIPAESDATREKVEKGKKDAAESNVSAQSSSACESCRWFEPTVATISFRYRSLNDTNNVHLANQGQQRIVLAGRFKFDKEGRYSIYAHASSGYYFNWAYADVVGGGAEKMFYRGTKGMGAPEPVAQGIAALAPNSGGYNIFLRQLYFSAKPIKGLEFQVGSLPILKGQNSETTSFDDDGYVAGERVSIKRPDKFWFDEISLTQGFMGKTDRVVNGKREIIDDVFTPNFFRRAKHFGLSNYRQFLVQKKFGGRATVSADYTYHEHTNFMREAVKLDVKESKVLDWVRFEAYQRIGDTFVVGFRPGSPMPVNYAVKSASGFSIHGERKIADRLTVGGGYNDVDYDYSINRGFFNVYSFALNGDRMGVGKRVYLTGDVKLSNEVSVSTFFGQAFAVPRDKLLFNKQHFNVAVNFDLLKAVKRAGWFN